MFDSKERLPSPRNAPVVSGVSGKLLGRELAGRESRWERPE